MNRVVVAGVLLWAVALGTSGVAVAGAVAPDAATSTAEDGAVTVGGFGGDARVRMTNDSVSARARSGGTTVGLEGLGTGNASGSLSSPALGDSAGPLRTGLCATGLDGSDSPLGVTVDEEAGRADVAFRVYREPAPSEASAGEVVASCTG